MNFEESVRYFAAGDANNPFSLEQIKKMQAFMKRGSGRWSEPHGTVSSKNLSRKPREGLLKKLGLSEMTFPEGIILPRAFWRYRSGGHLSLHTDSEVSERGITTCVIGLSSDYTGGELAFTDFRMSRSKDYFVHLSQGDCVMFPPSHFHGVRPVYEGERYVLTAFIGSKEAFSQTIFSRFIS